MSGSFKDSGKGPLGDKRGEPPDRIPNRAFPDKIPNREPPNFEKFTPLITFPKEDLKFKPLEPREERRIVYYPGPVELMALLPGYTPPYGVGKNYDGFRVIFSVSAVHKEFMPRSQGALLFAVLEEQHDPEPLFYKQKINPFPDDNQSFPPKSFRLPLDIRTDRIAQFKRDVSEAAKTNPEIAAFVEAHKEHFTA